MRSDDDRTDPSSQTSARPARPTRPAPVARPGAGLPGRASDRLLPTKPGRPGLPRKRRAASLRRGGVGGPCLIPAEPDYEFADCEHCVLDEGGQEFEIGR